MDNTKRVPINQEYNMLGYDLAISHDKTHVIEFFHPETLEVAKELAKFVQVQSNKQGTNSMSEIYWLLQDAKRVGLL